MRILVIEDEAALREQVVERLSGEGYTVDASGDGKEGLFLASEYPLDLAIIDLGLPGLPGLEIIRKLRADGATLPILILTAYDFAEAEEVAQYRPNLFLKKPFDVETLIGKANRLIGREPAGGRVDS